MLWDAIQTFLIYARTIFLVKELIFVTGNENKLQEARSILQEYDIWNTKLELPEIQGTAEEIVIAKAKAAFRILKKPCFVEDVSFGFEAWNGLPGPYIKDFIRQIGVEKLPSLVEGKSPVAETTCMIGLAMAENDVQIVKGTIRGKVVSAGGDNGFDYDRIFIPEGFEKRYSEMSDEEKNSISHRGEAYRKFRLLLERTSFED